MTSDGAERRRPALREVPAAQQPVPALRLT